MGEESSFTEVKNDKKKKKVNKLSLAGSELCTAKLRKRGLVFLYRISVRMGPTKVKSLLSDFGIVTRVNLEEEDKITRKRRKMATGLGGKRYLSLRKLQSIFSKQYSDHKLQAECSLWRFVVFKIFE